MNAPVPISTRLAELTRREAPAPPPDLPIEDLHALRNTVDAMLDRIADLQVPERLQWKWRSVAHGLAGIELDLRKELRARGAL